MSVLSSIFFSLFYATFPPTLSVVMNIFPPLLLDPLLPIVPSSFLTYVSLLQNAPLSLSLLISLVQAGQIVNDQPGFGQHSLSGLEGTGPFLWTGLSAKHTSAGAPSLTW